LAMSATTPPLPPACVGASNAPLVHCCPRTNFGSSVERTAKLHPLCKRVRTSAVGSSDPVLKAVHGAARARRKMWVPYQCGSSGGRYVGPDAATALDSRGRTFRNRLFEGLQQAAESATDTGHSRVVGPRVASPIASAAHPVLPHPPGTTGGRDGRSRADGRTSTWTPARTAVHDGTPVESRRVV
jgi:hypothetical protein